MKINEEIVFISGSIGIKKLDGEVIKTLEKIIQNKLKVLVGDAKGIDSLVQKFFKNKGYYNVEVFTIYAEPRFLASKKFKVKNIKVSDNIKSERQRQTKKDEAMTKNAKYLFVIWNGKSKGSFSNIKRGLKLGKKIKVYLTPEKRFLTDEEIKNIDNIYHKLNGYTIAEILKLEEFKQFKNSMLFYQFLIKNGVLKIKGNFFEPTNQFLESIYVEKYKGKPIGLRFKSEALEKLKALITNNGAI